MTTPDVDGLVEFLRARLDEDDLTVREANSSPEMVTGIPRSYAEAPVAIHIARFASPDRVLREVEAKRRMLRHYENAVTALANSGPRGEVHDLMTGATNTLRAVLLDHAAVYADHPDFREEWRP